MATAKNPKKEPQKTTPTPSTVHYMVPIDLPAPTVPWPHDLAEHLKPEDPDVDYNFLACLMDNTFSRFIAQRFGRTVYSFLIYLVFAIYAAGSIAALVFALMDPIYFAVFVPVLLFGPVVVVLPWILTIRTLFEFVIAGIFTAQNTARLVKLQEEALRAPRVMADIPMQAETKEEPTEEKTTPAE